MRGAAPSVQPLAGAPRGLLEKTAGEVRTAIADMDLRLSAFSTLNRLLPDFALCRVRSTLFKLTGCDLRRGAVVLGAIKVVGPPRAITQLKAGERCVIAPGVTFGLDAPITLGKRVSIGPGATLYTGTHELGAGSQRMSYEVVGRPIVVEDGVWIGMQSLILPGVRLGHGSVVAAGAVVHDDVAPNTLVMGNPAKVVRTLPLGDR
jgi:acetyltransferase-like isoleucine patch superfamily enzyme